MKRAEKVARLVARARRRIRADRATGVIPAVTSWTSLAGKVDANSYFLNSREDRWMPRNPELAAPILNQAIEEIAAWLAKGALSRRTR